MRRGRGQVAAELRRLRARLPGLHVRSRRVVRAYGPWLPYRVLTPRREFVIVTAGRTGSELLVDLLDSHPEIVCESEILSSKRILPNQFIGRRAALARLRGAHAYGFKLVRDHLIIQDVADPANYLRSLANRGVAMILLERDDLLAQAISHVRAAGDRYHHRRGDGAMFSPKRLDPVTVLATMWGVEDAVLFARQVLAGIPHLRLIYEDHLLDSSSHQATADLVCEHLGVTPHRVHSDLVKITPRTTSELVENFDELADVLSVTRYAKYLPAQTDGSATD